MTFVNEYEGHKIASDPGWRPPVISGSTDPEEFYRTFVLPRMPCIVDSLPVDADFHGDRWSNSHLRKVCGNARVVVERRAAVGDRFGTGLPKEKMTFGELIRKLESDNDEHYYMTTQPIPIGDDGRLPSALYASPITELIANGELPMSPALLGHLVIHQINIWFGHSVVGTSSGLHHDFHDNLYVVLRGRKTLRLYSPDAVLAMYPVGTPARLHANGLINYEGNLTGPNGAAPCDVLAFRTAQAEQRLEAAEQALAKAEAEADSRENGDADVTAGQKAVAEAEEALDELLAEAAADEFGAEDVDVDGDVDGDDDGDDDVEELEDEEPDWGNINAMDEQKLIAALEKEEEALANDADNSDSDNAFGEEDDENAEDVAGDPENFCRAQPSSATEDTFPGFHAAPYVEVTIHAGQSLFLPAGWFHEVTSASDPAKNGTEHCGHLALNYWYHPPDADAFRHPYSDSFWRDRFGVMQKHMRESYIDECSGTDTGTSSSSSSNGDKRSHAGAGSRNSSSSDAGVGDADARGTAKKVRIE